MHDPIHNTNWLISGTTNIVPSYPPLFLIVIIFILHVHNITMMHAVAGIVDIREYNFLIFIVCCFRQQQIILRQQQPLIVIMIPIKTKRKTSIIRSEWRPSAFLRLLMLYHIHLHVSTQPSLLWNPLLILLILIVKVIVRYLDKQKKMVSKSMCEKVKKFSSRMESVLDQW